ncbi:interferon gamma receptor 2 [Numida meleagris]|uniref:interferon gamma receptor 2 n=1 Tax=Numida meleagris TaxID=8996 RepID=UPI000B3DBE19|nr:interferon gamma receptor 2 [Numida meleagris]
MSWRAVLLFLLLGIFLLDPGRASGAESSLHLPAPKNVTVYSFNFCNSLRWSPVEVDGGSVSYTVQLKTGASNEWSEINCTRIAQTECSFLPLAKTRRWTVVLRVRAEMGHRTSSWVETDKFVAEKNTTIGPPEVSVIVSSDSLLVNVTPPFQPEPGDYPFQYHVSYWENSTITTKKEIKTSNTLFKIKNLKQWTLYCFTIQVELITYSDSGLLGLQRAPVCYRTTISEAAKAGYIVLIFISVDLLLIFIIVGFFCLWRHQKAIKYLSRPPLRIPSHFEEYLRDPSMPHLEMLETHEEDPRDSIIIVSIGEGSSAYGDMLDGNTCSRSSSSGRDVT